MLDAFTPTMIFRSVTHKNTEVGTIPILQKRKLRLVIIHWPQALADSRQASGVLTRSTSGSLRQKQKARLYPEYLEGRNPGRVPIKDRAKLGKENRE